MSELTIQTLMDKMPEAFRPEKAEGVNAVMQFIFTGSDDGEWVVTIKDGKCETKKGKSENPKMTLTADSKDYIDIITGKLDGMQAFMQGKVRLSGDLNLAMKITQFFKLR